MPRQMLRTCLQAGRIEAGCDEAGRGPLAGPVAAAAVILPEGWNHPLLNDSKKMSEKNRYLLRETIEREAVAWAVEMVSPEEIDRINILNASFAAMSRAVARLKVVPQMLLIDGNRFRTSLDIPYECIVKGDATFVSIAAASVLAKTYRDDYMNRIVEEYPVYNWKRTRAIRPASTAKPSCGTGSRLITGYPSAAISPSRICSAIGSKQRSPDRRSPTPRRTNRTDSRPAVRRMDERNGDPPKNRKSENFQTEKKYKPN